MSAREQSPPSAAIVAAPAASAAEDWALVTAVRLAEGGLVVETEVVRDGDLLDARAEATWRLFARRGRPEVQAGAVDWRLSPVFRRAGQPDCAGFLLQPVADEPGGARDAAADGCVFPLEGLEPVAARAAARLLETGALHPGERWFYELHAQRGVAASWPAERDSGVRIVAGRGGASPPLYDRSPLPPLLARSRPVDADQQLDDHIVFITEEALLDAERVAWSRAASQPPLEGGGVLVGPLVSCPETGEMYAVVTDVIAASDAEATQFSLSFSSGTWARIQAVLGARSRRPDSARDRLLGQTHCHPFLPDDGAPPCADCATTPVCRRSTAFLSSDDRRWCRAVFAGAPWQLGLMSGLNARGERVTACFGQRGGRLVRRGFQVLARAALDELFLPHRRSIR